MADDVRKRDVDGGWAWVALLASVLNLTLQAGFVISVGLFQVEFLETFSGSKGFIALIGALALSGQTLLGPVAGIISNLLTHRVTIMIGGAMMALGLVLASFSQDLITLLLLFGIVCGVGTGLCYTPSVTVISNYFHKYRTVANGITLGSPGVGVLISPYLMRWLIESYGWRYAMVCFGCFMAQTCVLASLFYPHDASHTPSCCGCRSKSKAPPTEERDDPESAKTLPVPVDRSLSRLKNAHNAEIEVMVGSKTAMHVSEFGSVLLSNSVVWTVKEVKSSTLKRLKHLLRRQFMWVMCLNQLLLMSGFSINTILFPSYAQSVGITYTDLPSVYLVYGLTMIVCRISGGFIFSLIPQHMLKVFFCLQVCVALVLALLPIYGITLLALFVYMFLVGLTYGPTFLLVTPILIHYIGLEDLSVGFGVIMLCCGCGYVIAPPLGGLMYDVFGDYRVSFYMAGSTIGMAALSLLLLLLIKDLEPQEVEDFRQEALMTASQKESEDGSSLSDKDNSGVAVVVEKAAMNGVHVIDDMEDLHKFIHDRHS